MTVDSVGQIGAWVSLAVDGTGRLHASYFDQLNYDLKYATCGEARTTATNWTATIADADAGSGRYSTSLAIEGNGRLHVAYFDFTNVVGKYATCAAACTTSANWTAVPLETTPNMGEYASLVVAGDGRLHLTYSDGVAGDLTYATCASSCTVASSWTRWRPTRSGSSACTPRSSWTATAACA